MMKCNALKKKNTFVNSNLLIWAHKFIIVIIYGGYVFLLYIYIYILDFMELGKCAHDRFPSEIFFVVVVFVVVKYHKIFNLWCLLFFRFSKKKKKWCLLLIITFYY